MLPQETLDALKVAAQRARAAQRELYTVSFGIMLRARTASRATNQEERGSLNCLDDAALACASAACTCEELARS